MSEKGTVVRVFSVPDGRKLRTFRRGAQAVAANCLSFNSTSTLLAVSSASSTVHIFNMQDPQESAGASGARGQAGGVVGVAAAGAEGAPSTGSAPLLATAGAAVAAASSLAKSLTARVTAMLPEKVQDMVEPSWHFAYVDMKDQTNLYCSFMGPSTVIVTTEGGFLYRFSVPAVGGACKLDSEHALFATGDDSQTQLLYAVRGAPDEEDAVRFEEDEAQQ
jgi:autophagy-related protein 18